MICLEKIPHSVSCTRSLHSILVNFLCFSYIFLKIYGRSMLCAWVILGYSFPSLLYVLPIWIVTKTDISRCIPSCLTTRDQMMPFHFFLKPLLFTKFLLFFHCSDLQVQLVILFFFQYRICNFDTLLCVAFQRLSSSQCIHALISTCYQTGYYGNSGQSSFPQNIRTATLYPQKSNMLQQLHRNICSYTNYRGKATSSKDHPTGI